MSLDPADLTSDTVSFSWTYCAKLLIHPSFLYILLPRSQNFFWVFKSGIKQSGGLNHFQTVFFPYYYYCYLLIYLTFNARDPPQISFWPCRLNVAGRGRVKTLNATNTYLFFEIRKKTSITENFYQFYLLHQRIGSFCWDKECTAQCAALLFFVNMSHCSSSNSLTLHMRHFSIPPLCGVGQCHTLLSMTMTPNTMLVQEKHTRVEKHTVKLYNSALTKHCGIIWTENNRRTSKEDIWISFMKPGELFLRTT